MLANPRVVVEVLSRSTEAYDRGEKWEAYQRLASVTDYLLVEQGAARISVDAIYEGAFDLTGD